MLSVVVAAWGGWLSFQALKPRDDVDAEYAAVRKILRYWTCYAFLLAYDAYGCFAWVPGHGLARMIVSSFVFLLPPAWGATDVAFFVGLLPSAYAAWAVAHGCVFKALAAVHDVAAECARPFSPAQRAPKTPPRDPRRRIAELLRDSDDDEPPAAVATPRLPCEPAEPASCVAEPGTPRDRPTPRDPCDSLDTVASATSSPQMLRAWSREISSDDDFDADAATKGAKRMKVTELRAALAAAGADPKGFKAALVERLVGVQRAAASGRRPAPPTLSPAAFSETDEADAEPPRKSPFKRMLGLGRRLSPRKTRPTHAPPKPPRTSPRRRAASRPAEAPQ